MSKVEEEIQTYLSNCKHFTEKEYQEACTLYGKKNVVAYINKLYRTTDNLDEFLNKYHAFLEERENKSNDDIDSITKSMTMEIKESSFLKYYINIIKDKKILTPEEERALFTQLNYLRKKVKFLNIVNCLELRINYWSIFTSIKDEKNIKSLIKLYKVAYKSNNYNNHEYIINNEKDRKIISKYLKLYDELSRPLTEEEIISYFPDIDHKHHEIVSKEEYDQQIDDLISILNTIRELEYSNLKLVFSVAKQRKEQLPIEDLIQEGNIGLRKAILMFDSTKGYKFSTYATWWIRQSINRGITLQRDGIRKPFHIDELLRKYRLKYASQMALTGNIPTTEEMAEILEISCKKCRELEKLTVEPLSLNLAYGEDEEYTLLNTLSSEALNSNESLEAIVNMDALKSDLQEVLLTLTPKEADIIIRRFGLGNTEEKTLEELGEKYGVTRERIRQIEAKALRKLRHPTRSNKLKGYLN